MKEMRLMNSDGKTREIKDRIIISDDGKEIDTTKGYRFRVIIPHFKEKIVSIRTQTLPEAYNLMVQKLKDDFNFDSNYANKEFSNYKSNENFDSYSKLLDYAKTPKREEGFRSVIMFGDKSYGCGKTHLMNALANMWLGNPMTRLYFNKYGEIKLEYSGVSYQIIREEDLILRILNTYKKEPKESELEIYDQLFRYDILAIDDIGKYAQTNMEFYRRVIFQIIDTRYNWHKGVVLSTNFSKGNLVEFLGVAIADRLNEMASGYKLEFKGKSYRG